jgi:alpha-galactosidase
MKGMTDKKTTLTLNEQYSYMSMWSLMAAPLFLSGNMAKLDAFVRLRGSTFAC